MINLLKIIINSKHAKPWEIVDCNRFPVHMLLVKSNLTESLIKGIRFKDRISSLVIMKFLYRTGTWSTLHSSYAIMQKYIVNDHRIPKRVTANGNCFFNAVSLSLYGNEHYSVQIFTSDTKEFHIYIYIYMVRADRHC